MEKINCPSQLQKDDYNLPSHDALAQILPDYLVSGGKTELQNATHQEQKKPNINRTYKTHHPHKR